MDKDLVLVSLSEDQIKRAKEENRKRKQITHALVVSSYGIIFGTERQCRKYYSVWSNIFNHLFVRCYEIDQYHINNFVDSGNVVMSLIEESDGKNIEDKSVQAKYVEKIKSKKKGFLARFFGT